MSDLEIKKTYGLFANPLNKKLIADLQNGGEDLLVFPTLQAHRLELTTETAENLKNLHGFDWIILTDVLAADFFIEGLRELEMDFFELDHLTIGAVGEAVADRLRFVQVHADVIPPKTSDEAVFAAISNYAGVSLTEAKFLVVSEESAGPMFIENLRAAGATVEKLLVYRAFFTNELENVRLKTLLAGGAVDEFIFSMPEDLLSLKFLTPDTDLTTLLSETRVSAVSEIVFQTLQENGWRPLYFHRP